MPETGRDRELTRQEPAASPSGSIVTLEMVTASPAMTGAWVPASEALVYATR